MSEPKIIGFVCRWVDDDLDHKAKAANGAKVFQLNCVANITANSLSNVFTKGADVVFILGCGKGTCKYYDGESKTDRTTGALELLLQDFGLEPERLLMIRPVDGEEDPFGRAVKEAKDAAKRLGPNPLTGRG